jgi:hypothetical protein
VWKTVKDVGVASDRNARFRRTMEDAHVAVDELVGCRTAFFGIYDGHGGRGAVNFVQEHLHVNFREQIELGVEVPEAFKQSFLKTDADMANAEVGYSGSTVAAAYIQEVEGKKRLYTANCGDARVVLVRNGQAQRMTVDHKVRAMFELQFFLLSFFCGRLVNRHIGVGSCGSEADPGCRRTGGAESSERHSGSDEIAGRLEDERIRHWRSLL